MLHESLELQKPVKPMAKCHFHSILHSSPTPLAPCYKPEAASSPLLACGSQKLTAHSS